MATKAPPIVRASDGRIGTIVGDGFDRTGAPVDVLLEDGERLLVAPALLTEQSDGSFHLKLSDVAVERESDSAMVVPLVAEEIEVGKHRVETGKVRVRKTVKSTEHLVDEPILVEEVEVERVVINRPIAEASGPRQEGDTLIVPLYEEVLVVEKRLILREEVRITRRKSERRSTESVVLRTEEATIERSGPEASAEDPGSGR